MKRLVLHLILFLSFSDSFAQDFWKIYNSRNTPALQYNKLLTVIDDDLAFILSNGVVVMFSNGQFTAFDNSNLPKTEVRSFCKNQKNFWIDYDSHFAYWNGTGFTLFPKMNSNYRLVAIDKTNKPWFKYNGMLYVYDNNQYINHLEFVADVYQVGNSGNIIGIRTTTFNGTLANFGFWFDGNQQKTLEVDTNIAFVPTLITECSTPFSGNFYLNTFQAVLKVDLNGVVTAFKANLTEPLEGRYYLPMEEADNIRFYIPKSSSSDFFGLDLLRTVNEDSMLLSNIITESNNAPVFDGIQCSETKVWVLTDYNLAIANQTVTAVQTHELLDVNSIKASFSARNVNFTNYANTTFDTMNFQILGGQLADCFYASNLWIGGIDENDAMKVSKNIHGAEDFAVGRINNVDAIIEAPIFKITRAEIDAHKFFYNQPGYKIPESIKRWPANGNAMLGQFLDGAPFYDLNDNGLYEPALGDYPFILGDQAVCWFSNDQSITAFNRTSYTMGLEVFSMAFGFNAPNNPALDQTVFLRNTIINRSGQSFDSVRIAFLNDFDIGNPFDDFLGCDSSLGIGYAYNSDDFDENFNRGNGFLNKIPSVGMKFLSHPLHSATAYTFDSFSLLTSFVNPSTIGTYNRLNNVFSNNYQIPNWQYVGDPLTSSGQTEGSFGNTPNDRSNFMITNIDHFAADERITFDVVVGYGFAPDQSSNYLEAIPEMKAVLNGAATYFENMIIDYNHLNLGNGEVFKSIENDEISVYPNPTLGMLVIDANRPIDRLEIYSISGETIRTIPTHRSGIIEVDLSGLNSGLYILKMYDFEGNQHVRKVVKQ